MKVFRINEIVLRPVDVIAKDCDHAARVFIHALREGFEVHPGADFTISHWTSRRLARYPRVQRWAAEERAGLIWPSTQDDDWQYVSYDPDEKG